jgi:peptidoglycan/LPS O-acetylase OafA/YrhL
MNPKNLEALTWLRAFAAFFVVMDHCFYTATVHYAPNDMPSYFSPLNLLRIGDFAVYLFFALSGCTLAISNAHKIKSLNNFTGFYIKRFMRIWPAFALSLLVYVVFIEIFKVFYTADKDFWIGMFLKQYTLTNIVQYLALVSNITGPKGLFIGAYWTLPVEFQYYLLLPLALLLMKNKITEIVVPLMFGVALYVCYQKKLIDIYSLSVFKMGYVFFGGVLLARIYPKVGKTVSLNITGSIFIVAVIFLGILRNELYVVPAQLPFISDINNLYGLFALAFVALALLTTPLQHNHKVFNFIAHYGEISYSIYLFHMLFIGVAVLLIVNLEIYGGMQKLAFVLCFALVGSYTLAKYTYRYVEQPSIALGSKWGDVKPG